MAKDSSSFQPKNKRIEDTLVFTEDQFKNLMLNIPGVVYRCLPDDAWTVIYISDDMEKISGYPASDFIHNRVRTVSSIIHPEDRDFTYEVLQQGLRNKLPIESEYRFIHADGSVRWVLDRSRGVYRKDGKLKWLDGVVFDITRMKVTEQKLGEQNAELKALHDLKHDFVSVVTHELRTPLHVVHEGISQVKKGKHGGLTPDQQNLLNMAHRCVQRLRKTVDDLMDIHKLEAGLFHLEPEPVDLATIVAEVQETFFFKIQDQGLDFKKNLAANLPPVSADKDKIVQLFVNLVGNAIKYTEKGSIEISAVEEEDSVRCCVADTGLGIPEADLPKVFERFEQTAMKSVTGERGSGLGLFICREIVHLHQGKIWVESKPGQGTKFYFTLPQAQKNK